MVTGLPWGTRVPGDAQMEGRGNCTARQTRSESRASQCQKTAVPVPQRPWNCMTGGQWFEPSDAQPHPPRPCPQSHHLSGGATRCFLSWTRCPSAWLFPITSKPLNLGMPLGLALYNRARFCRPHTASSSPSPMCTHTSACLNAYTAHMYARHTDRCTHPIL